MSSHPGSIAKPSRITVVTGTSTGVGKTIATAALCVQAIAAGQRTLMVKPAQTGTAPTAAVPGDSVAGDSDAREVRRLAGCEVEEWVSLAEPLAPETAARRAGIALPTIHDHAWCLRERADRYDRVVVEGAGGLMVRLDTDGGTVLDLAATAGAEVVIVCAAGLGTLNHTELTAMALRARGIEPAGLIIGAWPDKPDLAETCNLHDLPRVTGVPLLGVIPAGAGSLPPAQFQQLAPGWASASAGTHEDRPKGRHVEPAHARGGAALA